MTKQIYNFSEGSSQMSNLLGGKGANLAEMTRMGLPVPHGFTITTEACHEYQLRHNLSAELLQELDQALDSLSTVTGKKFGAAKDPLLVSVRSGAAISMPGMMDTILNIGLNDESVSILARLTGNERFAYDSYRRLLAMFGNVVFGLPETAFDQILTDIKKAKNYDSDLDLTIDDLKEIVSRFKEIYADSDQGEFPQDPKEQLLAAVNAVFDSWNNHRAQIYRQENHISEALGTAVNIQEMVFGNFGQDSGTGVAFTRNPSTGEAGLFGEYLINAQGEDVVAGIRTPQPVSVLQVSMPVLYAQLLDTAKKIEAHYRDMQDMEFTIEQGKMYLLQTRSGKRTPTAAVRIAVDMAQEGLLTKEDAILSVEAESIAKMLHPEFDPEDLKKHQVLASGLPASPGAATGQVYFTSADAKKASDQGIKVVLVRSDTSPEDIEGMIASQAIVTSRGGMTSHAAVVARGMASTGVVGAHDLEVDYDSKTASVKGQMIHEGDWISVDGSSGNLYLGQIKSRDAVIRGELSQLLDWAKQTARMGVYTNADTPKDFQKALDFGADGIGLTRTEHMFFKSERLLQMRRLILAENKIDRQDPLLKLLAMQQGDFYEIYRLAAGKEVTIRLLDPPLHEFLPHDEKEIAAVSQQTGLSVEKLRARIESLKESNPMLGHRGDRLAVTFPDIYEMQVQAIMNAVLRLHDQGIEVTPHIMIPLTNSKAEMGWVRRLVVNKIEETMVKHKLSMAYTVGTMIETPRACVVADEIAEVSDFFSFGTNDLTQLALAFSRDDVASFMPDYLKKGILPADPFQTVDTQGVGQLMKIAIDKGRRTKPNLDIGVCGEVGGDAASIDFFEKIGVSYVSCSPYRVPVARMAAAQAHIRNRVQEIDLV
ncbi:pyruvate, phosphate dikinase [Oenococcus kitaharae]|uniref:Pyruvate, phosphate dikinase n=1 Tax=Oenococcus kitaharae DSM 17330 TaxID=1045004 RepID=G9WI72_9LACO|nr:pyruvate, phosphate dikinase [Oenococcus kitaharae]EHN59194.1 Pyruvatephosphate dikinase [Oenococcus kitaharae DSM 17330]OEY82271.1 pyruvate phosphate dikinase [Oenococcus kitaharae]OEY82694.1 pyruvate phosphate dikinase [Oenococcus kitaharae]OEY84951.1 pyruvate phosphate dikinase [Oenococcus kitaharae]